MEVDQLNMTRLVIISDAVFNQFQIRIIQKVHCPTVYTTIMLCACVEIHSLQ